MFSSLFIGPESWKSQNCWVDEFFAACLDSTTLLDAENGWNGKLKNSARKLDEISFYSAQKFIFWLQRHSTVLAIFISLFPRLSWISNQEISMHSSCVFVLNSEWEFSTFFLLWINWMNNWKVSLVLNKLGIVTKFHVILSNPLQLIK